MIKNSVGETKKIEITESAIKSVQLSDSKCNEILIGYWSGISIDDLLIQNEIAPLILKLYCTPKLSTNIFNSHASVIELGDADYHEPLNNLSISNVKIDESIDLSYRTINQGVFNRLNLMKVKVNFFNARLKDCSFSNIIWPSRHRIYEYDGAYQYNGVIGPNGENWIGLLWGLKEVYRQLKVSSINQSNKIDAQLFQANELRIYHMILNNQIWSHIVLLKSFRLKKSKESFARVWPYLSDWVLLSASKWFTGYGLSWIKPLISGLVFHGLFFLFFIKTHDLDIQVTLDFRQHSWYVFFQGWDMFWKLFLPVHDSNIRNVVTNLSVEITPVLDVLMRVSSSFFIFYVVKGTRKFNFSV